MKHHAKEISERTGRSATWEDVTDRNCFASAPLPDLDGDGVDDLEVTEGCSWGMYAWVHLLYLSNRGCRRFAGEILDGELGVVEDGNKGARDLEATWSNGCAGDAFVWRLYRWNGTRYAVADRADCDLCEGSPVTAGKNTHPHCQRELARRRREK